MFITATISLDRWDLALRRLDQHIDRLTAKLDESIQPVPMNLNTYELLLPRTESSRSSSFSLLNELDNCYNLRQSIQSQYERAEHDSGVRALEFEIQNVLSIKRLLEKVILGAPSRSLVQEDLQYAINQYAILRSAGDGDTVRAERARLRELIFNMPILGVEDLGSIQKYYTDITLHLDAISCRQRELRARSGFAITPLEEQRALLSMIGVSSYVTDKAEDTPEPAPLAQDSPEPRPEASQPVSAQPLEEVAQSPAS